MTYRGHIENGVVVFDEPVVLAEGTVVRIEPAEVAVDSSATNGTIADVGASTEANLVVPPRQEVSLYETLKPFVGTIEGLPSDFAQQHDHYIHGTPRE
jgi:hypothetical protein